MSRSKTKSIVAAVGVVILSVALAKLGVTNVPAVVEIVRSVQSVYTH